VAKLSEALSYDKITSQFSELESERSEWFAEWQSISNYLVPGRGIYQSSTKPKKRKLTSPRVINPIAEDALYVLTSGMHSGLTSPSLPWFRLEWADPRLNEMEMLVAWLQECERRLFDAFHASNFYSVINSFYIEYTAFGTGSMYMGSDTDDDYVPFRFELLTAGEYAFATDYRNRPTVFMRPIFMSPKQVVEKYEDTVSDDLKRKVEKNEAGVTEVDFTILEAIFKESFDKNRPYTRVAYETTTSSVKQSKVNVNTKPLVHDGFYEFPYPTARWNTIGSDIYGIGPGSRALPDIRRLQEMEKSFLMGTHKAVDPPLYGPARLRGKLNSLPGGYNYYSNPAEVVTELHPGRLDFAGVSAAIERVEQRLRRIFFNDVFLTANRDPNATPYKATEVLERRQEKMLRLGPIIERLQNEFLQPIIERGFNIMLRKDMFPELPPDLAQYLDQGYNISMISPLAVAQRSVALDSITSFLSFIGQAAQFDQSIMDNVNVDEAARTMARISGVQYGVLRSQDEVKKIRNDRSKAMAAEKQKQEQIQNAMLQSQLNKEQAEAQKIQSEAGMNLVEGIGTAQEGGLM